jgi:hypothetical protein
VSDSTEPAPPELSERGKAAVAASREVYRLAAEFDQAHARLVQARRELDAALLVMPEQDMAEYCRQAAEWVPPPVLEPTAVLPPAEAPPPPPSAAARRRGSRRPGGGDG